MARKWSQSRLQGKLHHYAALDRATRSVTAMRDFADLLTSITRDGYVPSLYLREGLGAGERRAIRLLRHKLHTLGHRIYPAYKKGER